MRINHNIAALNTYNKLSSANSAQSKSMEKLSSGLRINSAADDAAGLAISEKMRGQIRGLDQAAKNAQDGISLVQTAEGALSETTDILQRMRELAVQSANDTNTDDDRAELQKEVNQLSEEISRISSTTEFNTQNLLGGKFEGTFQIGANSKQNITLSINDMSATALKVGTEYTAGDDGAIEGFEYKEAREAQKYTAATVEGGDPTITYKGADGTEGTATWKEATEASETEEATVAGYYTAEGELVLAADEALTDGATGTIKAQKAGYYDGDKLVIEGEKLAKGDKVLTGIDISSQSAADSAITTINDAIQTVSGERSKLGAYQNRLDHTINNLSTSSENLTAAESRIRDVDMAKEMMNQTKNSILSQAAQAMLAQANQQPQGVLQLLR